MIESLQDDLHDTRRGLLNDSKIIVCDHLYIADIHQACRQCNRLLCCKTKTRAGPLRQQQAGCSTRRYCLFTLFTLLLFATISRCLISKSQNLVKILSSATLDLMCFLVGVVGMYINCT